MKDLILAKMRELKTGGSNRGAECDLISRPVGILEEYNLSPNKR
jgi:hypothetical protein